MNRTVRTTFLIAGAVGSLFITAPANAQGTGNMFPTSQSQTEPAIASDPAQPFVDKGKEMITAARFSESKEALKTALRLSPMNLEFWSLYDDAVIGEYTERMRKEKLTGVIERDITPIFSITRVDSYIELGTLYIVGSLQNISREPKQKISLTAKMLDENKRELRTETGTLRNTERGLLPNESSLFEIPFKNPPPGFKSFRVEVSGYE